jgi:hypothetical protein
VNIFTKGASTAQDPPTPQDFMSSDLPAGHDTLWGWVAKWSPDDLTALIDPIYNLACETKELQERSMAEGFSVVDVQAPRALQALGVDKVPAFDTQLLYMASRS